MHATRCDDGQTRGKRPPFLSLRAFFYYRVSDRRRGTLTSTSARRRRGCQRLPRGLYYAGHRPVWPCFSPRPLFFLTGFRTAAVERSRRRPPVVGGGARVTSAAHTTGRIAPRRASCGLPRNSMRGRWRPRCLGTLIARIKTQPRPLPRQRTGEAESQSRTPWYPHALDPALLLRHDDSLDRPSSTMLEKTLADTLPRGAAST